MKKVILSKREAGNQSLDSLFTKRKTFTLKEKIKYDKGKYATSGIGKKVDVMDNVKIIWSEPRKDKHGKYYQLYYIPN